MLSDIIQKHIADVIKTLRIAGHFKTPEEVDTYFEKSINETAEIVAREVTTSLTEAHKQHEHEMYEELEKAHREEMEKMKKIVEDELYQINFYTDGNNPGAYEAWEAISKKFNI